LRIALGTPQIFAQLTTRKTEGMSYRGQMHGGSYLGGRGQPAAIQGNNTEIEYRRIVIDGADQAAETDAILSGEHKISVAKRAEKM
jgi:hypothetical protein